MNQVRTAAAIATIGLAATALLGVATQASVAAVPAASSSTISAVTPKTSQTNETYDISGKSINLEHYGTAKIEDGQITGNQGYLDVQFDFFGHATQKRLGLENVQISSDLETLTANLNIGQLDPSAPLLPLKLSEGSQPNYQTFTGTYQSQDGVQRAVTLEVSAW